MLQQSRVFFAVVISVCGNQIVERAALHPRHETQVSTVDGRGKKFQRYQTSAPRFEQKESRGTTRKRTRKKAKAAHIRRRARTKKRIRKGRRIGGEEDDDMMRSDDDVTTTMITKMMTMVTKRTTRRP